MGFCAAARGMNPGCPLGASAWRPAPPACPARMGPAWVSPPCKCFLLPLSFPNAPHITRSPRSQPCSHFCVLLHTSACVLVLSPTARESPRAAGELSATSSSRCCPWLSCTSHFSLARSDRARWVTALMHREREQPDTTPRGGTGVQIPHFCPVCTHSCLRWSWGHIDGEEESSGYCALLVRSFSRSDISLFLTQSTNTFPRRDRRKPGGGLGCSSASHVHAGQGRKLGLHWRPSLLTRSLFSSCPADLSQVEITRAYMAKQADEISLQQADVVLVLGGEDGKCWGAAGGGKVSASWGLSDFSRSFQEAVAGAE